MLEPMANWIISDNEFYAMVRTDTMLTVTPTNVYVQTMSRQHIYKFSKLWILVTRSTMCRKNGAEWYTRQRWIQHVMLLRQCLVYDPCSMLYDIMGMRIIYNEWMTWVSTQREPNVSCSVGLLLSLWSNSRCSPWILFPNNRVSASAFDWVFMSICW